MKTKSKKEENQYKRIDIEKVVRTRTSCEKCPFLVEYMDWEDTPMKVRYCAVTSKRRRISNDYTGVSRLITTMGDGEFEKCPWRVKTDKTDKKS